MIVFFILLILHAADPLPAKNSALAPAKWPETGFFMRRIYRNI
jgi:hypothetical protein